MKAQYLIPALLLLCGTLLASAIAGPRGGFGKIEGLDLNDEQKTQLQALHEARREKMQALHESGERPSREDRQALQEEFREDLAGILTPKQLALLEEHRANRPERGHRGKRGGKGRFGHGFGSFDGAGLELSEDQKEQMKTLHEAQREKMQALRAGDERPSHEDMQSLREEFRTNLAGILTPEQLAQLEERRANRPERGHRGKRGGKGRFGRGFGGTELDLSEDQKEQAKALRQAQHEKMHALRESGERPNRETMQALRAEFRASFESILTSEQLEKLAAHKAEHEAGGSTTSSSTLQVAPTSDAPATAVEEKTWGKVKKDVKE
jgi:Spy/CpxP family protein refolding chaperone